MSDIVERLGNLFDTEEDPAVRELYADCKYEIERLLALLRKLRDADAEELLNDDDLWEEVGRALEGK